MIEVIATFKGQDGSLRYRRYNTYRLNFLITEGGQIEVCDQKYSPNNKETGEPCLYKNLGSFLNNWTVKQ